MKIYYYSGTHWDREWYETFQGFRKRLVDMIDELLDYLEAHEDYGVFHMDGQTIILNDYFEIRPENLKRVNDLIKSGRIVIGPWYNMPDEFLVSGESMIKNLRLGMGISQIFDAEPSKNAYICDIFGHSSQTPQIFSGMGLCNTVLGRGTNDGIDPAHFVWEALDGSSVTAFKLCDRDGYGDLSNFIRKAGLDALEGEEFDRVLKEYVDREIERTGIPLVLLMDAIDHQTVRKDTPRYLDALRRLYPDAEIRHASIDEFCEVQNTYKALLETRKGELCTPARDKCGYNHVITNTLSSRYPLKQYNDRNQTRLEKWAEPIYALRRTDMAHGFLRVANRYLLENHPHDSICGCSIDQVHKDMIYRFDQTAEICDEIERPFIELLKKEDAFEALTDGTVREGLRLRVYSPLPYRARRTVTATVDCSSLPYYREPFGYEKIPAFRLYGADGEEIPYGYVRALGKAVYEIAFACELSPFAVTEFSLVPSETPTRHVSRLLTAPRTAVGDNVSVTVNRDGTVDLTDRKTGEVYRDLLTLIDDGEIGDGWYHCAPNVDVTVSPTEAEVSVIENSAVRVTFRIVSRMMLPREAVFGEEKRRSDETVPFRVTHEVTLAKEDRGITVHTYLDNNVCDHRLRLRLPTAVTGETYEASQAFGHVTRTCSDDPSTADWREYRGVERNMTGICAKRNGRRGLAFVSAHGLHECGVWENGDVDVTLFRAFRKTVRTNGEPGGELLGRLDFTYRILPYTEDDCFAELSRDRDFLGTGTRSVTVAGGAARVYRPDLEVTGRSTVYSTVAPLELGNASEVRVYNDSDVEDDVSVTLPSFAGYAALVELDGRKIRELPIGEDMAIRFTLPPFRIATVRFR